MFELMVSRFRYDFKPQDFDIRTQIPAHYNVGMATVKKMAELVGEGRCWRNAHYNLSAMSFKKQYVIGSHFVVLDFDEVIDEPEKMCEILEPNFWYYTLSHGIKPKSSYRMVWVLSKDIKPHEFEHVMDWFLDKFPKADRNTKDITRMWYGGNGVYEVVKDGLFEVDFLISGLRPLASTFPRPSNLICPDVLCSVGPNWEEEVDKITDLWRIYKEGNASRAQRLKLIGNLKFLTCEEKPIIDEILKYSKKPEEVYKWYEELKPSPIANGKTLAEHFSEKLF